MSRKVLVIDDALSVRRWLSTVLVGAGFRVVHAVDGIDGAKQIRDHNDLSIVVCDVNLPRLSGLEMIESMQQEIAEKGLTVVVLTSETRPELINRGKRAGVKGWFIKPLKDRLLVAALTKLSSPELAKRQAP
jgi:two-component system, chemotaxis family, chemotaxis protein CheY